YDQHAHVRVVREIVERDIDLLQHLSVQRVGPLRARENKARNRLLPLNLYGCEVCHGLPLTVLNRGLASCGFYPPPRPATSPMSIAAIIPLYNGARFIKAALESVFAQTRKPDEIIVVDDGSTDDGPAIVKAMQQDHPQIVLLTQSNGGQGAARNAGVAQAKSDLIAFLDQDDVWYPHHLAELEKRLIAPSPLPTAYAYSNLDQVDIDGRMFCHRCLDMLPPRESRRPTLMDYLSRDLMILPGASLIRKSVIEEIGGFDERLRGYEDDDLFLRIFRAGYRGIYIDEPLTKWCIHPASASFDLDMARSRLIYFEKLLVQFPDEPK